MFSDPLSSISDIQAGQPERRNVDTIIEGKLRHRGALNRENTFENFIEGKSNQLARAAAMQVAENPGYAYNPLFIYGGVGLGKTHLMHAIGNYLVAKKPGAKVVYLHSETFVATMVTALQLNAINEFKRFYRSVDALLIDDIQFFAGKERSQEEFFHTFNALLEGGQQIILTCDRYHKEINGLEERLKSRFGWGLTVAVEPPELETRAAILINKAALSNVHLPNDAALFIAQRLRSNVRELEGALKRVIAHANFKGEQIDLDLIKEALRDLFALQDKLVTIDNIQRSVAEYYKIKMADMLSKRRNRSVARPRQVAMSLSKELTNHSLPEIGDAFGGRDHTTVIHACKQVNKLRHSSNVYVDGELRLEKVNFAQTSGLVFLPGNSTLEVEVRGILPDQSEVTVIGPVDLTFAAGERTDVLAINNLFSSSGALTIEPKVLEPVAIEAGITDVRVTVLHAAPEVGTVDVYVTAPDDDLANNTPVATLSFGEAAGPVAIAADTQYQVRITPTGTLDVVYDSGEASFPGGTELVLAAVENTFKLRPSPVTLLAIGSDSASQIPDIATGAAVRVVHNSADTPAVDILVNGSIAIADLTFPNATQYDQLEAPAGTYTVAVAAAADPSVQPIVEEVTLSQTDSYTVIAAGVAGKRRARSDYHKRCKA